MWKFQVYWWGCDEIKIKIMRASRNECVNWMLGINSYVTYRTVPIPPLGRFLIMVCLSPQASAFGEVPWRSPMSLVSTNSYLCHIKFHRHSVRCLWDPRWVLFLPIPTYVISEPDLSAFGKAPWRSPILWSVRLPRANSIGIRRGALEIPDGFCFHQFLPM